MCVCVHPSPVSVPHPPTLDTRGWPGTLRRGLGAGQRVPGAGAQAASLWAPAGFGSGVLFYSSLVFPWPSLIDKNIVMGTSSPPPGILPALPRPGTETVLGGGSATILMR